MPVTAKLSKAFYDRFGEQVVSELVDWFNLVDATYRGDLKDLNELNFARFDAKLEQRVATIDAKLEQLRAEVDAKLDQLRAELKMEIEKGLKEQTRYMFLAWASLMAAILWKG